jgi:hypothetical protein
MAVSLLGLLATCNSQCYTRLASFTAVPLCPEAQRTFLGSKARESQVPGSRKVLKWVLKFSHFVLSALPHELNPLPRIPLTSSDVPEARGTQFLGFEKEDRGVADLARLIANT